MIENELVEELRQALGGLSQLEEKRVREAIAATEAAAPVTDSIPEGAAFFKALKHGATFKWMELVQTEAPQARIDAQGDLQALLAAVARKVEEIEAMEAALPSPPQESSK